MLYKTLGGSFQEVVVQQVKEVEVVVETVDDLPEGWGLYRDSSVKPHGYYYFHSITLQRSNVRPDGEEEHGCGGVSLSKFGASVEVQALEAAAAKLEESAAKVLGERVQM